MQERLEDIPRLSFRAGRMLAQRWPSQVPPPFGMLDAGAKLVGPARLRWRLRQALQQARIRYLDEVQGTQCETPRAPHSTRLAIDDLAPGTLLTLQQAGYRGVLVGLSDAVRMALVDSLVHVLRQRALVVVVDSGAEHRWRRALAGCRHGNSCSVRVVAGAAQDMHWLGARYDVLVVDAPELMPGPLLERALDASAALCRVGLVGRADWRTLSQTTASLGPLIDITDESERPHCREVRVAMPDAIRDRHAEAWATFLCAYDRFAALRPGCGFGTFVEQARRDPVQRPALHAWHEALRLAAWHEHKAQVTAELLQRHHDARVLVFTPDRRSAYELASNHLIPAITAEIPRAERAQLLDAFAEGKVRALAGPRLLDLGVVERSADVAILVGGGYGRDQRRERCRRVTTHGIVYELVSLDTVEVGRAHRWRQRPADATAVVHGL